MDAADPTAGPRCLDTPTTAPDAHPDEDNKELLRERERVRDLLRYYTPPRSAPSPQPDETNPDTELPLVPDHGGTLTTNDECSAAPFPSVGPDVDADDTPPERLLANDPTLTAFAQLGAFRLNCERSFISLMDHGNQYILAEATRSVSLNSPGDTAAGDEIYLGARVLDMTWGVCPNTIQVFTALDESKNVYTSQVVANQKCYVMNDLSAIEAFKNRPYVAGWPYMRFYAEVPIHSPTGHVIGTYCVVDDKPRAGLDEKGLTALNEIANTIMKHLQLIQVQHGLHRAREMINGLGKFIDGESSAAETIFVQPQSIEDNTPTPDYGNTRQDDTPLLPSTLRSTGSQRSSVFTSRTAISATPLDQQSRTNLAIQANTLQEAPLAYQPQLREKVLQVERRESIAAQGTRSLFLRAGGLIQEAIRLDGVLFVKVCKQDIWIDSGPELETKSDLIASSLDSNGDTPQSVQLSQPTLRAMVQKYPSGHIFLVDQDGIPESTRNGNRVDRPQNDEPASPFIEKIWTRELLLAFPGAKAMILYPLWDAHRGEWFAASMAWTCDPQRILQGEDLTYLAAFGSSIMSEKSRLDALRSDRAKAEFISSVSHELRSPLHGILAGTEALQANPTKSERDDMIRIVTVCGEVLLETVDQILEYSKFSNPAAKQSPLLKSHQNLETSDISVLVENILDGVVSGYQHRKSTLHLEQVGGHKINATPSANDKVSIILTIEWHPSWVFASKQGRLKRILINLFSNALKYTPSGFIHVSLRTTSSKSTSNRPTDLVLQIEDSGIGMSKSYLENKLYTPFVQENPQATGTGLGLSIVRQLVHEIGGLIDIQSEVGYGTVAKVSVPSVPVLDYNDSEVRAFIDDIRSRYQSLCIYLYGFDVVPNTREGTEIFTRNQRQMTALKSSITNLVTDWFQMEAKLISSLVDGNGGLIIALESQVRDSGYLDNPPRPLIILADEPQSIVTSEPGVFRLYQPVGPRKLARVLSSCFEYQMQQTSFSTNQKETTNGEVAILSELKLPETAIVLPLSADIPHNLTEQNSIQSSTRSHVGFETSTLLQVQQATASLSLEPKPSLVLLVEDNPINLKILVNHMKRSGQDYITAQNGLEALNLYHTHHAAIKLIFMDISMPVMDGLTSTRHIRAFERGHSLPRSRIVAVTCFSSQEYQQHALESGIDMFLVKPVPMKSLQPILDLDPRMEVSPKADGS